MSDTFLQWQSFMKNFQKVTISPVSEDLSLSQTKLVVWYPSPSTTCGKRLISSSLTLLSTMLNKRGNMHKWTRSKRNLANIKDNSLNNCIYLLLKDMKNMLIRSMRLLNSKIRSLTSIRRHMLIEKMREFWRRLILLVEIWNSKLIHRNTHTLEKVLIIKFERLTLGYGILCLLKVCEHLTNGINTKM